MKASEAAAEILALAVHAGATAADATVREGKEFLASVRLGTVERLLQSDYRRIGLRVFRGKRSAVCSTSDFSSATLEQLANDAVALAGAAGEDPAAGLPDAALLSATLPELHLCFPDASEFGAESKIEIARRCEEASFRFDPRISNSEGSTFSDSIVRTTYVNSLGTASAYSKSTFSLSATPLAESDGHKQRDWWLSTALDFDQLKSPEEIGSEAARRTLRRLGARKVETCAVPVVFDPVASASLLKHLADAVSGTTLLRKASFLAERLGTRVASPVVTLIDDGLLAGGLGTRPFDAEGVPSQTTCIVRNGILENYLLDSYSARRLGLRPTSNSNRDLQGGNSVGPTNFYLAAGTVPASDIVGSVRSGLYVTELIGFGVDIVSGNYSQGAAGVWIEKGVPAFPVEEVTVAGNLKDMLTSIEAVGDDPLVLGEVFSPTLLVGRMIVSGS